MKIELCEDNGFLNNGKPTLVVLVIDGKIRIPYEATKTIQELYQDVAKMPQPKDMSLDENIPSIALNDPTFEKTEKKESSYLNEIEREDIVKCIKKYERDPGADDDLVIGNEYRILDIKKKNGEVIQYDVLDDNADMRIRIPVFPDEIELTRKRIIQPKRSVVPDMIKKCGQCKEENALLKVSEGRYEGICEKCGSRLIENIGEKHVNA